jgi:hypothetical protein
MSPAMNVQYTCPTCGTVQSLSGIPTGGGVQVPECSNPACNADPVWGPISLTMMKDAIQTNMDGHPTGTTGALAKFVIRLLNKARPMAATADADSVTAWQDVLAKLAAR